MNKTIILSSLLVGSMAFGVQTNSKSNAEEYLKTTNSADNTKTEFTTDYKEATKLDASQGFYNYKEVVYSRIVDYRTSSDKSNDPTNATKIATFDIEEYQKKLKEEKDKEKNAATKEENATAEEDIFIQGYCRFKNDVEVSKLSEYSYLDCDFNEIGKAQLAVLIVPDFYAQALVAQPLYLSISDEYENSKRLNTINGAILNATKTSINIANLVNDYMLEKIIASTSYQGATIATNQAKAYLDAKSDARKNEQITYVSVGDGVSQAVKSTNTQMPETSDYITGAAVELVSSIVKTLGKSVLSNINYSFKVNKGSMVYADIVVSGKTSPNNNGGVLKKTKLINKDTTNEIKEDGTYDFIPKDNDLEINIDKSLQENRGQQNEK